MPDFVTRGVHRLSVVPAPACRAVLHLSGHNGPVPIDGVGVELNPEVGCPHRGQLRWSDGNGGLWKANQRVLFQTRCSSVLNQLNIHQLLKYRSREHVRNEVKRMVLLMLLRKSILVKTFTMFKFVK